MKGFRIALAVFLLLGVACALLSLWAQGFCQQLEVRLGACRPERPEAARDLQELWQRGRLWLAACCNKNDLAQWERTLGLMQESSADTAAFFRLRAEALFYLKKLSQQTGFAWEELL